MAVTISSADAKILKRIARLVAAPKGPGDPSRVDPADMYLTPEVYIAELPEGGIPALTVSGGLYIPGTASCRICRIQLDQTTSQLVIKQEYFNQTVFNISLCHIGSDLHGTDTGTGTGSVIGAYSTGRFRVVQRDKFGRWLIEQRLTKRFAMSPVGGIPKGSMSLDGNTLTPGSAGCQIWSWLPDIGAYKKLRDGVGALVSLTIYNPWPTAINANRLITFSEDDDGLLTVDAEACEAF